MSFIYIYIYILLLLSSLYYFIELYIKIRTEMYSQL